MPCGRKFECSSCKPRLAIQELPPVVDWLDAACQDDGESQTGAQSMLLAKWRIAKDDNVEPCIILHFENATFAGG